MSPMKKVTVKLLTILIRTFECEHSSIATRHLHTVGITGMTAVDIFEAIKDVLVKYGLEFSNLVSIASDTFNVIKGVRNGVSAKIRQEQPKVLDIHCICHVVSLCVKSAVKALPIKIDEILVDIYYHFHNSVKSIASLKEYAEFCDVEFKVILKHCDTRWLSLRRSINRAIEMWDPLLSYFTSHPEVEKALRRIKTDFRPSLLPETISSLIGVHFNSPFQCCSQTDFPTSFLDKAKSCTREMNASYRINKEQQKQ